MTILATLNYAKPLQEDAELSGMVDLLRREGVSSYLEVGARYGGSFEVVMSELPEGSSGVAVDFPGGHFGDCESAPILMAAVERVRSMRRQAHYIFGPSSAPEVIERVTALAPFDAVLIDADHSYESVKRDFELYAPLARIVMLHDVSAPAHVSSRAGRKVEVPRFWSEIKGSYRNVEIIAPGSVMGVGVIYNDLARSRAA